MSEATPKIIPQELLVVTQGSQIDTTEATRLQEAFAPLFAQAKDWATKANGLVITDASQVTEMVQAREVRLALKDIRINAEKTRKAMKEESLRKGKAIDGMYNVIEYLIVPIEKHLEEQENFVKRQEEARKKKLAEERKEKLQALNVDTAFYKLDEMTEVMFEELLRSSTTNFQLAKDKAEQDEKDRIAREEAEAKKREDERLEREALAKQNAEKDELLMKEREEKDRLQREADKRAEDDRKTKEKEERDRIKEAKRKAKMTDADKVQEVVSTLKAITFPEVKNDDTKALFRGLQISINAMVAKVEEFAKEGE